MTHEPPATPRRLRLGRWFLALLLVVAAWLVWRDYDYRCAVREAKAAGYKWKSRGSFDPIWYLIRHPIRVDWQEALQKESWTRYRHLNLGGDADLARVRSLLHRLRPTQLGAMRCLNTDLDALKGLTDLQELYLLDCPSLQTLDGLQGLTALRMLGLGGCPALQNADILQRLTALQMLDLSGCPALQNVDGLKGHPGLEQLYLRHCPALQNVDGLRGLSALHTLDLKDCPALQNVDALKGLTRLRWLDLSGSTKIPAAALRELLLALPKADIFVPPDGSKAPPP